MSQGIRNALIRADANEEWITIGYRGGGFATANLAMDTLDIDLGVDSDVFALHTDQGVTVIPYDAVRSIRIHRKAAAADATPTG